MKYAVLVSKNRMAVAFDVNALSQAKRTAIGVVGMKFDGDDHVSVAMLSGERFEFDDVAYPLTLAGKRGSKGKELKKDGNE